MRSQEHREQAERWLREAEDGYSHGHERGLVGPAVAASIALAHATLATINDGSIRQAI